MITIPYNKDLSMPETATGKIACHLWPENDYTPPADFTLCYNETGLRVRLRAAEPSVTVTTREDDGPVWEDSCLELFLAPFEEEPDYLNFECNAAGAMIIGKGPDVVERVSVVKELKPLLDLHVTVQPGECWEIGYTVPFAFLEKLYGKPFRAEPGKKIRLNAFLCGDNTPQPHFLSWSPIDSEEPNFHRPEFFGEGVLGQ